MLVTQGLDALVALDIIKLLRATCRAMGITVVSVLYQVLLQSAWLLVDGVSHVTGHCVQPGQEIFDLFDKVCVLAQGKQLYFGPTQHAASFFAGTPVPTPMALPCAKLALAGLGIDNPARRTLPDFLVSLGATFKRGHVAVDGSLKEVQVRAGNPQVGMYLVYVHILLDQTFIHSDS